ncbi:MAG TPA: tRNA uracil 4-sulfurtransferase ThiI [Planctomycetota bacterium]|nr:tRNA uracil 4-sulfurtransferase ThiI [Planctomycetota bacterium]
MGLLHVRYDEVGLKGGNRPFFEKKLRKNLSRQLRLEGGTVRRIRGRIIVQTGDREPRSVLPIVQRVFGVASASPVVTVDRDDDKIYAAAIELAREAMAQGFTTFKVDARRADKTYPRKSTELAGETGFRVLKAMEAEGKRLKVSLHSPQFVVGVEVRREGVYLHAAAVAGPGGVPVGVSGRALVLLSGGIDSPVAAWHTLKRGMHADFVYFHAFPYTGDKAKEKVLTLARELSRWAPDPLFTFIPNFARIQDAIADIGVMDQRVIILRRFMYRVAEKIATLRGHKALVTGEALGQVASQTPENLLCVERVVPRTLVLRPLIGLDKKEVIDRARAIGTFETSTLPYEDCCSLFAPRHPATKATPEECEDIESRLEVEALEAEAMDSAEVWKTWRGDAPVKLEGKIQPMKERAKKAPAAPREERPVEPKAEGDVLTTDFSEG